MFFSIDGGKGVTINYPAVFWHHPDFRYRYGAIDEGGWDHHYVLMRGKRAKALIEKGFMQLSKRGFIPVVNTAKAEVFFHEIISLFDTRRISVKGEILVVLESLLNMLINQKRQDQNDKNPEFSVFCDLAENISLFPGRNWNFEEEARKINLSYSHFRRKFREINGVSPYGHLLSARIKKISCEIRKGKKSVKELSYEMGFNNYPHFCSIFREKVGISPAKFGKMFRETLNNGN